MLLRYASSEAVALAWLSTVVGTGLVDLVDNQLPADNSTWAANGFFTVTVVGGDSAAGFRFDEPVVSVQSWACALDSSYPPWGKARNLIEAARVAAKTYNRPQRLDLGEFCDEAAGLKSVHPLGSPRKSYGDFGGYASFVQDFQLHWVPAPK